MTTFTTVREVNSRGEKLAQRLSHILALLHQNDAIDKHRLAKEFHVDVRTIERDLGNRLRNIAERNAEGRWQLTYAARSTVPTRHLHDYAELAGTAQLFPDSSLRFLLEQLQTPAPRRGMQVRSIPGEDLREHHATFTRLQTAIQQCHECSFHYKGKPRQVQPYRLIHKAGVWYLCATESGRLKNFSVALIGTLRVHEDRYFSPDAAHQDYIDANEDVWVSAETTEVLLRVAPAAAHYFTRRALLPRQQQRADADGSLLVTARINHPQQLMPVVRYWLPHVRIVRPSPWHDTVVEELRQALAQWEGSEPASASDARATP